MGGYSYEYMTVVLMWDIYIYIYIKFGSTFKLKLFGLFTNYNKINVYSKHF